MNRSKKDGLHYYCKTCARSAYDAHKAAYPESVKASKRDYRESHLSKVRRDQANYMKNRYSTDLVFKMKCKLYSLVRKSLTTKGFTKNLKTFSIVCLTGISLHEHLIQGFFAVYNRYPTDNDDLDIDHIIPLAAASTIEDVLKLNHYSNLRYLLVRDNRVEKRDRLDWHLADGV